MHEEEIERDYDDDDIEESMANNQIGILMMTQIKSNQIKLNQ